MDSQTSRKRIIQKLADKNFNDLHRFRGLGEDPVYHQQIVENRFQPFPDTKGYNDFFAVSWKGLRLLKDPETQATYHNLLWELKPKTIVELGVYSGGSLVWFRDLAKAFGFSCTVVGVDIDLSRCQIQEDDMSGIKLIKGDCNFPENINLGKLEHPILFIDDAHCNTFNVLKYAIVSDIVRTGDYFVIEDTMPMWRRYSPKTLQFNLGAFSDLMVLDSLYSNTCPQLKDGVFKII
ncbi:hypothetical protein HA402_015376 [Bradysia odoriphaga]|nr:hypothetical protein HA402_015376 [Bradysia odoriphaga]